MAAVRTGTASEVDAGAAQSSSVSVTVPSDCTLIIAQWDYYDGGSGGPMTSIDLDSVNFTLPVNEGDSGNNVGLGLGWLLNPATGSQTFAWDWGSGGAKSEGGLITLTYIKDHHATDPIRDTDWDRTNDNIDCSITVTSETTDIVIAQCGSFNTTPTLDGTVYINDRIYQSEHYDASQVTAGASSTTVNMLGEEFSGMVGVSIKEAAGPVITDVDTDEIWDDADTGLIITGTGFVT